MKHLPKSTPTEILNDPYGFTYKEMSEVIGEDKARALYTELYKQPFHKKNLSISTKKVYKSSDTEKYVYELKDNRYIETVFIKRRDGGTVCVSNLLAAKRLKTVSHIEKRFFYWLSMKGGLVFYAVHIDCSRLSVV